MMQLCSEILLKEVIQRFHNVENLDDESKLWMSLCEKELLLLQKLKIEEIDLTGSNEEVVNRLDNYSLYFLKKEEFDELIIKAEAYDQIKKLVDFEEKLKTRMEEKHVHEN